MRSKDIGTRAETAVVNLCKEIGYIEAMRLPLRGSDDHGDIRLSTDPLIILEVKAGKAAQNASWGQIQQWIEQTQHERDNAWRAHYERRVDFHGFLVTQRRGYGVGRVADWCIWTMPDDTLQTTDFEWHRITAMFPLGDFLTAMLDQWRRNDFRSA